MEIEKIQKDSTEKKELERKNTFLRIQPILQLMVRYVTSHRGGFFVGGVVVKQIKNLTKSIFTFNTLKNKIKITFL